MRRTLLLVALALFRVSTSAARNPGRLSVTILEVGRADATLVQAPNGQAMLVDAGEAWTPRTVASALDDDGVGDLACVVAPHQHDDHIGGMVAVLEGRGVRESAWDGVPFATATATALGRVHRRPRHTGPRGEVGTTRSPRTRPTSRSPC